MEQTAHQAVRALQRDIEHDREVLDRTLTQLQEKLTMEHMISEARHNLANRLQAAAEMARRHPLPAAVVMLLATGAVVGRSRARSRRDRLIRAVGALGLQSMMGEVARRNARAAETSTGVLESVAEKLPERVVSAGQEIARETGELLHAAQGSIQRGGQRVQERIERLAEVQPGLLNALAMALGGALVTALSRRN